MQNAASAPAHASLGLPAKPNQQKGGDKNAFTALARVGKFFWQQMTRIR